ncbi:MAG: hypothetical protein ACRYG8_33110 [Janthinobacterium lividum]
MTRTTIVLLALLLGAAAPEPDSYRLDDYRADVPDTIAGATVVHVEQVRGFIGRQDVALIDVLPAPRRPETMRPGMPWLPQPHESLPGAVWWPDVGRGALAPELDATFHQRLTALAGPKHRRLVFFCLSRCWMSWNAAKRAAAWGFDAAWFPDGVDGWEAAGLSTEKVAPLPLD